MGAWFYIGITIWVLATLIGIAAGMLAEGPIGALIGLFGGGFVGMLLAIFPLSMAQVHYNERTISCHVTEKDRGGKEDGMRVYTSCGTFQNTNSILRGKNTSADLWARIHPGQTQTFHVVGWRLGLTSDFPNILDVR
ncbi:hypothetical protein SEA_FORTHEBOIS_4 [Streptomyces phage Forthebois]|uniref:Uncharacterized protein n=1 Tax=Streptomyces phage Forthebois TaxID=2562185 RepID=A0A4D6E2H9_9VIRU|nr:secreted protein [Streptomyces phage Forthebois]QBZ72837.1 hypothetical protein SEA_FORTHEBOIS_4 [Streptomyces phage Forthebois]